MRRLIALSLLFSLRLLADTVGSAFPLANTRYGATGAGTPMLHTNGSDLVLFSGLQ